MSSAGVVCSFQLPKIEIVGVSMGVLGFQGQLAMSLTWVKQLSSKIVCVANVYAIMEAPCNDALRCALAKAALVTTDDMPLTLKKKKLDFTAQDRVAGISDFTAMCQRSLEEGISFPLLGSAKDVLERIQRKLRRDFSALRIAGIESLPFRSLTEGRRCCAH